MESLKVMNSVVSNCEDGEIHLGEKCIEYEDISGRFMDDFDSYWLEINERLTISRMVGDSVIKGMVNAVSQEAAEKIAQKELEVAELKERLHFYRVGAGENECSGPPFMYSQSNLSDRCRSSEAFSEHYEIREHLGKLRNALKMQMINLKQEIINIVASNSTRRIDSGSQLLVSDGGQPQQVSENVDMDRAVDQLEATLEAFHKQVEDMVHLSTLSLSQWQEEQEFQADVKDQVFRCCIQSLQEEFELKLLDHGVQVCNESSLKWTEKIKEISHLRQEFDIIAKSLSPTYENGQLSSHSSLEPDHLHCKKIINHTNGTHEESDTGRPETLDASRLGHLKKDELVTYINAEITKLRRNHESQLHEITEENFSLKRELFKERGSLLSQKKDKEFDILKKKISDIISKAEEVLVENEKLPSFCEGAVNLSGLRDRLDSLFAENRQLRNSLAVKKDEVKCLLSKVSNARNKLAEFSDMRMDLMIGIENQKCEVQDARIEGYISEEVSKSVLKELSGQIGYKNDRMNSDCGGRPVSSGILSQESVVTAESASKFEIEDSDMESIIKQSIFGIVLEEALKDAREKLDILSKRCIDESKVRVSLEMEALKREEALRVEISTNEGLRQEIFRLKELIEKKEKLGRLAAVASLEKEGHLKSVIQELSCLSEQSGQQQILLAEKNIELVILKSTLLDTLEQIKQVKAENSELNQKLEQKMEDLRTAEVERSMLQAESEKNRGLYSLVEATERECRKQMQSSIILVRESLKEFADFEQRVTVYISKGDERLRSLTSQARSLIQEADMVRRTALLYKQKLQSRCSDLQKAEAEVDLLGDEVDTLLGLLENIYIALDHYSPILKHYPGIVEILKLVRRELSGDSTKAV